MRSGPAARQWSTNEAGPRLVGEQTDEPALADPSSDARSPSAVAIVPAVDVIAGRDLAHPVVLAGQIVADPPRRPETVAVVVVAATAAGEAAVLGVRFADPGRAAIAEVVVEHAVAAADRARPRARKT